MADAPLIAAARNDIAAIEALSAAGVEEHCAVICYLAQQAAEKMVKNIYRIHDEGHPFTHNIAWMLSDCQNREWLEVSEDELASAFLLTELESSARYETSLDLDKGSALEAIVNCNLVADVLEREGFSSCHINTAVSYLRHQEEDDSSGGRCELAVPPNERSKS